MDNFISHIANYFNRPIVVAADILLLILGIISVTGVIVLRSRVNDLAISIKILADRITKGSTS